MSKVVARLLRLNDGAFLARTSVIIIAMTDNAAFPYPWPSYVPPLEELKAAHQQYSEACEAARNRDGVKVSIKGELKQKTAEMFAKLGRWVELVAGNDVAVLKSSGFELAKVAQKGSVVPTYPEKFIIKHGTASGTVVASAKAMREAYCYELQYTTKDPTLEESWKENHSLIFAKCHKMAVTGLEPGRIHSFRLRAIGHPDPGPWTPPFPLMVI